MKQIKKVVEEIIFQQFYFPITKVTKLLEEGVKYYPKQNKCIIIELIDIKIDTALRLYNSRNVYTKFYERNNLKVKYLKTTIYFESNKPEPIKVPEKKYNKEDILVKRLK